MKVMLDTNICIYLIKQQPPSVIERFLSQPVKEIGISSITAAELTYGVSKSRSVSKNRRALEQFLGPLEIAQFEAKGTPIGSMDMLIAAHALSLGVRLVSNNLREFRRVPGLRLENWA
ncbi:MAG: PIN domain-containing protein [Nitrospira sp.]|nr:PIN domain-containing protein [Nitrospira sp.]